jgi:ABC-2 type transport system ATP-binding protein
MSSVARRAKAPDGESLRVPHGRTVLDTRDVSHRFGDKLVLDRVSFRLREGQIHALLGPNGAGKTTLIRILAGLLHATEGFVNVAGFDPRANARAFRQQIGFLPSGDRSFYLRISGLENLLFFARLHGMTRRAAVRRALEVLADVGLEDAARLRVASYSHGMQKRLSVARALLTSPPVLLVDEATHDLDPAGAQRVRDLIASAAANASAVVWATQRLDEINGFANGVTLLDRGRVRFVGSVPELMALAVPRRFVVQLDRADAERVLHEANGLLTGTAELVALDGHSSEHFLLALDEDAVLGDALAALTTAGLRILSCREERSNVEEAFLRLTEARRT